MVKIVNTIDTKVPVNALASKSQYDSDKVNLKKMIEDVDKKITDTTKFIETQYFNKLTKLNFDARMAETSEYLATKNQVETEIDLKDKNREKIKQKVQTLDLSCFIVRIYFDNNGSQNYLIF